MVGPSLWALCFVQNLGRASKPKKIAVSSFVQGLVVTTHTHSSLPFPTIIMPDLEEDWGAAPVKDLSSFEP